MTTICSCLQYLFMLSRVDRKRPVVLVILILIVIVIDHSSPDRQAHDNHQGTKAPSSVPVVIPATCPRAGGEGGNPAQLRLGGIFAGRTQPLWCRLPACVNACCRIVYIAGCGGGAEAAEVAEAGSALTLRHCPGLVTSCAIGCGDCFCRFSSLAAVPLRPASCLLSRSRTGSARNPF